MPADNVNRELLQEWWHTILGLDLAEFEKHAYALAGLDGTVSELGLPALPEIAFTIPPLTATSLKEPAFKNLDLSVIAFLRQCAIEKGNIPLLDAWVEMLLRYMEINLHWLKNRITNQFGYSPNHEPLLNLTALIMDYFELSHDLRYLNLALKLMDTPGLVPVPRLSREFKEKQFINNTTLISLRLILMRTAALKKLETGIVVQQ